MRGKNFARIVGGTIETVHFSSPLLHFSVHFASATTKTSRPMVVLSDHPFARFQRRSMRDLCRSSRWVKGPSLSHCRIANETVRCLWDVLIST